MEFGLKLLQNTFLDSLAHWLSIAPDDQGAPDIDVGEFTLNGNAGLIRDLCDQITPHENLMSYKTFQKLLLSHNEKPSAPDKNNPAFDPAGVKYKSATERAVAKAYRFKKAQHDYEKRYAQHQEIFTQPRARIQGYRANADGYMDYCKNALCRDSEGNTTSASDEIFFISRPFKISEAARRRHSFLTGGTGSGKSEALKHLIRHYETKNTDSPILSHCSTVISLLLS